MSENIKVIRIVDRYLEHGRIFIFHNNGKQEVFMGSSDWMDRNLHRRIEVCFPIHKKAMKEEVNQMINLQLNDSAQAVIIDSKGHNIPVSVEPEQQTTQSQRAIYTMLTSDKKHHFIHDPIH